MNEENKVLTPNETPETTVEDTKETAPVKVADDKNDKKGKDGMERFIRAVVIEDNKRNGRE